MPKAKKRGRGAKGEKEKPLLTLQGVLKLEKSFVTEQHEGAESVMVQMPGIEKPVEIKLIPGQSEHDLVAYKAGYDVGPSNPFPQNEPEKEDDAEEREQEEAEDLERPERLQDQQTPEALEEAFDTFGDNLNLSSCINIINCSELHEKNMTEPEQVEFDIFYVPSVLADIGKHKLSKQLDEIIQNIERKSLT